MDPLDEISGVGLLYKREPGDLGRASTKRARLDKSMQYQSRDGKFDHRDLRAWTDKQA